MKRALLLTLFCIGLPAYAGYDKPTDKAEDPEDEYVSMVDENGKTRSCYIVPHEARQDREIRLLKLEMAQIKHAVFRHEALIKTRVLHQEIKEGEYELW